MNILKSIFFFTALITTTFGAAAIDSTDDGIPHVEELSICKTGKSKASISTFFHPASANVWYMMCAMLSGSPESQDVAYFMSLDSRVCSDPEALSVRRDMEVLKQKLPLIIALIICSNTPVHEVLQNNDFHNLQYLMSKISIKVNVDSDNRGDQNIFRKRVANNLAAWAGKSIITAADISEGAVVNDGDIVVLSYDDMIKYKAVLKRKDLHLCVDVYADPHLQLIWDHDSLPSGLKKLVIFNTAQDVAHIGSGFLATESTLEIVDLSGLINVAHIGKGFLFGSAGLRKINVRRGLKALLESKIDNSLKGTIVVVD